MIICFLLVGFVGDRYVYSASERAYIPPTIDLGKTASELHALHNGLSTQEARARLNRFGPNQIPFEPGIVSCLNSILEALEHGRVFSFPAQLFVSYFLD